MIHSETKRRCVAQTHKCSAVVLGNVYIGKIEQKYNFFKYNGSNFMFTEQLFKITFAQKQYYRPTRVILLSLLV